MRFAALVAAAAWLVVVHAPARARADDHVTVRGAYYREPSTRVVQPTVEIERDSPSGLDVTAHYLVDAITSASIAAGTSTDAIFTETRNEVGFGVRKRWSRAELGASYKYSAESDYWSHALGLSGAGRFWGDTARVGLSLGLSLDTLSSRGRTPECATPPDVSCTLRGFFGGLSYTQILSPVLLAQASAESAYLGGFQGNLYRSVPSFGYERVPDRRLRNALAGRVAYYFPRAQLALRLQYRYYFDVRPGAGDGGAPQPWLIRSHTLEARVYRPLSRTVDLRLTFRQYLQSRAQFWCDAIASPGCYPVSSTLYSTDPKLGHVRTEFLEAQLLWRAEALAEVPVLGWVAAGTFELAYGRFFQSTSFADAHVLQAGYTLPY